MQSKATTVKQYLAELPPDRRTAIEAVRKVILANLDKDYDEGMQYGMIGYHVPHRVFPDGYHCDPKQPLPYACLASQKNHMAVYLSCVYGDPEQAAWFQKAWAKTGKKLDMGQSCVRFKRVDDLALDVIGEAIRRTPAKTFVARYLAARDAMGSRPAGAKAKPHARAKGSDATTTPKRGAKTTRAPKTRAKSVRATSANTKAASPSRNDRAPRPATRARGR